ncbi:MAG TPA: glycosyltransferase family 4 protein [Pyrinomonadaceae bacterium]|nr:glycosyltransferase family 4 protein [Pyrinomonadaceae bacterium]
MTGNYIFFILAYLLTFAATYIGVERFRQWSLQKKIFDIPNERSSHTQPTPRGGGLVIFLVCAAIFGTFCLFFEIQNIWGYFAGAIIVSLISWLDDLYEVSVIWRFSAHSLAAATIIWNFGFWEKIYFPFAGEINLGVFGIVVAFFWIVWLINAYNFMDGIDGIAGVQAVAAGIGWFFVGIILNINTVGFYGIIIALSAMAFLIHNWQPAKVFMGDVGSAFLGFTFAVMPFLALPEISAKDKNYLPLIAVALVSAFVFDSVWTLLKRLFKGEKIWKPHREHIYQNLVIKGFSHQKVTIIYLLLLITGNSLLIVWLKLKWSQFADLSLFVIFLQLLVLLIYSFKKKSLT